MSEETLNQLNKFESILKKCIIDRFKNNLPDDRKNLLLNTNFIKTENFIGLKNGNEIQGKILRDMLNCIINIKASKDFSLEDGTSITLILGEDIEKEIIEFYAANISDKYKFTINTSSSNLTLAFSLIENLGTNIENVILNCDINQIFNMPTVENFAKLYTDNLLKPYSISKVEINPNLPVTIVKDPIMTSNISEEVDILSLTNNNQNSNEDTSLNNVNTISLEPENKVVSSIETTNIETKSQGVISDDKYKELCMKFARNEVLSPEEFNMLLASTPQLMSEEEKNKLVNSNINLSEVNESQEIIFRGFTISSFPSYFVIFSIIFLIILGFILL